MGSTRTHFSDISSRAWQHPSDAAALVALRQVPGLDDLARALIDAASRMRVHPMMGKKAREVSAESMPRVEAIYAEALEILDAPRRYPLFAIEDERVNGATLGSQEPIITLTTAAIDALSDDEILVVLGHELGHVMCEHVVYQYLSRLLLVVGWSWRSAALSVPGYLALNTALKAWGRTGELSADRASLLVCQDVETVQGLFCKLSGQEMSASQFAAFAEEKNNSKAWSERFNRAFWFVTGSHPQAHDRALEVGRWAAQEGGYDRVIGGDYPLRSDDPPTASDKVEGFMVGLGERLLRWRGAVGG